MWYVLDLGTGWPLIRCVSAEQAARYAHLYIVLTTGQPPQARDPDSTSPEINPK